MAPADPFRFPVLRSRAATRGASGGAGPELKWEGQIARHLG